MIIAHSKGFDHLFKIASAKYFQIADIRYRIVILCGILIIIYYSLGFCNCYDIGG